MRLVVMWTLGIKRIAKTTCADGRRGPRALYGRPSLRSTTPASQDRSPGTRTTPASQDRSPGTPGVAAKDGAPTFEGKSRFQKLRVGHPPTLPILHRRILLHAKGCHYLL